jgi:hypothetical protein
MLIDDLNSSEITVKKDELLSAIRKNRESHRGIFLKAQDGYRAAVIEELDRWLADARAGRQIKRSLALVEPEEHTKDYDRIIRMLEMSQAETIKISERQFSQYVLDEWGWSASFTASNSAYTR